ncbi:FAD synthase [Candidatus Pacearchaeota archaeon]|jgi:FAD synthetase|nr:FAD synthase [Candidatus Pacearchaeota archaeon]
MGKVLVFGSFDLIHLGHRYFFKEAKKIGDTLIVVVGRDSTVERVKGEKPWYNENERLEDVKKIKEVDRAFLGSKGDKFKIVEDIKPDVIALGYDQDSFTDNLEEELKKRGLRIKIVRLEGYMTDKYKSSLLKKGDR